MKKRTRVIVIILIILLLLFAFVFLFLQNGKNQVKSENKDAELTNIGQKTDSVNEGDGALRKGEIMYEGKRYRFNRDVVSVLIMGMDESNPATGEGASGQNNTEPESGSDIIADPMFLLVMNPHLKKTLVIAINRDALAEVNIYNEADEIEATVRQQISTQFRYGDGKEKSCERQVEAVSGFLHDLPINGYAAIDMKAIPLLTDSLGGIPVTVLEDMEYPEVNMNLKAGEEVLLTGEDAYHYVHLESNHPMDNYDMRFDRQKQYMTTFLAEAKHQASKDITIALSLYKTMNESKVTDISLSKFTYLVTESVTYDFDISNMYSLEGAYTKEESTGKNVFTVDEEALETMLIDVFYEMVE